MYKHNNNMVIENEKKKNLKKVISMKRKPIQFKQEMLFCVFLVYNMLIDLAYRFPIL